jgi:hypothetical protein
MTYHLENLVENIEEGTTKGMIVFMHNYHHLKMVKWQFG